mmetsp:Transcript_25545/g.35645  ORF Transcript_25545/g.35645 Transcript_25545/m.35645 type:complete len:215 (-) Transcript_25545:109-753(-)
MLLLCCLCRFEEEEECRHFPYQNWVALFAEFQNKCPRGSPLREYLEGIVRESTAHILTAIFGEVFRGFMGKIEFRDIKIHRRPSTLHRCDLLLHTQAGEFCRRPMARYLGQSKKTAKTEASLKVWEVLISGEVPTLEKVESLIDPKIPSSFSSENNQRVCSRLFFKYPVPPPPSSTVPTYVTRNRTPTGYSHDSVYQNEDASSELRSNEKKKSK